MSVNLLSLTTALKIQLQCNLGICGWRNEIQTPGYPQKSPKPKKAWTWFYLCIFHLPPVFCFWCSYQCYTRGRNVAWNTDWKLSNKDIEAQNESLRQLFWMLVIMWRATEIYGDKSYKKDFHQWTKNELFIFRVTEFIWICQEWREESTSFLFISHFSVLCSNGSTLCNEICPRNQDSEWFSKTVRLQDEHILSNVLLTCIHKNKPAIYYELHFCVSIHRQTS